jgi:hypothetical protein
MKGQVLVILSICAAVALAWTTPLAAQKPAPAPAAEIRAKCMACHKEASLQGSVHESTSCLDCHSGLTPASGTPPHQPKKDIPQPSCTLRCHQDGQKPMAVESPGHYPDSVHGRAYLQRGEQEVAKCWDCHGKHNIKNINDPDSTVNRKNIPLMCSRCHENMSVVLKFNIHAESPYQEYRQSVHGKALFDKGLLSYAAVCTDCHGVHNIQAAGAPHLQAKNPETCGRCHVLIMDEYKESIHGREALKGNYDVPVCVDCHGEHKVAPASEDRAPTSKKNIPDTCSACHARPEIMKKYGVPQDRITTFIESFHGIAIGFGDKAEANCTSCHGVHDIRPANDPKSKVNPANLAHTCGQTNCHPGMPARIAAAKIHRDVRKKASGAPYYVQKVLIWVVILSALITAIWFIPELIRRLKGKTRP